MARRVRSKDLETRSSRLRLPIRPKPYAAKLMRGVHLLYRRNKTAGPFMLRIVRGDEDWTERLGIADDYDEANGKDILTYWQAQDLARTRARIGKATGDDTIRARVEQYKADLENRGRDPKNAARVLTHLSDTLAGRTLTAPSLSDDLVAFREGLGEKVKPTTVDRITNAFKAALNFAADGDERITKRPWKAALKAISHGEEEPRNVILDDPDRRTLRGRRIGTARNLAC